MPWRRLLGPIRIVGSVALIAYLIAQADPSKVWERWRGADLRFVGLAVLVQLAGVALNAVRWGVLLDARGQRQPYRWLLGSYLAGQFANNFLPTSVGGDAVRAAQLARKIGSISQASASVFLERLTGFLALSLIVNLALLWSYLGHTGSLLATAPELRLLTILFTVAAIAAMAASFSAPRLLQLFGPRLPRQLQRPLERIARALGDYVPQGRTLVSVLGLSVLYQTIWIFNHIVCGWALHIDAPNLIYFLMVPITDIVGLAPIFVNNLGAREAVFTLYLGQVGVSAATAIALAFLIFTVRLVVSLIGGLVVLFGGADLRAAQESPADAAPRPAALGDDGR
jgi:uncharacterized protein (TIRG00374 family)